MKSDAEDFPDSLNVPGNSEYPYFLPLPPPQIHLPPHNFLHHRLLVFYSSFAGCHFLLFTLWALSIASFSSEQLAC